MTQNTQIQISQNKKLEEYQLARQNDLCKPELASLTEIERKTVRISCENQLIRNTEPDQQEGEIKRMILTVCSLLGIKNLPDPLTTPFLMRFIREHYSSLSVEAMIHAFELNAAGLLCEKRHEHFQNFGIEFIADVLGDYTLFKRKTNTTVKRLLVPKEIDLEISDKDCYEFLISFVKKNGELPRVYNWDKAFNYVWSSGLYDATINENGKFKDRILAKMKSERLSEIANGFSGTSRKIGMNELNARCRKEYLILKLSPKNA